MNWELQMLFLWEIVCEICDTAGNIVKGSTDVNKAIGNQLSMVILIAKAYRRVLVRHTARNRVKLVEYGFEWRGRKSDVNIHPHGKSH